MSQWLSRIRDGMMHWIAVIGSLIMLFLILFLIIFIVIKINQQVESGKILSQNTLTEKTLKTFCMTQGYRNSALGGICYYGLQCYNQTAPKNYVLRCYSIDEITKNGK